MSLVTLLFSPIVQNPLHHNLVNSDNFNKLLHCFLTVLEEDRALTPYSIGYDSEEEALNIQQESYEYLINALSAKVSRRFFKFTSDDYDFRFLTLFFVH